MPSFNHWKAPATDLTKYGYNVNTTVIIIAIEIAFVSNVIHENSYIFNRKKKQKCLHIQKRNVYFQLLSLKNSTYWTQKINETRHHLYNHCVFKISERLSTGGIYLLKKPWMHSDSVFPAARTLWQPRGLQRMQSSKIPWNHKCKTYNYGYLTKWFLLRYLMMKFPSSDVSAQILISLYS